jgi:hypothetical protein
MKASYAVTSEGDIVDTCKMPNVFKVRNIQKRTQEISSFVTAFATSLGTTADSFSIKFQPFYTEDHIMLMYKVPLESSNPLVRRAYDLRTGKRSSEFIFPADYPLLKSIYSEEVKEKTQWYALYVQDMVLERNIFDCMWIQIVPLRPVTFYEFERYSEVNLITPEQLRTGTGNKAFHYPSGIPTAESALRAAMPLEGSVRPSGIEGKILSAMRQMYHQFGFDKRYRYANKAFYCLYAINDRRYAGKIFVVYQEIKDIIKRSYPTAYNIRYNDRQITFQHDEVQTAIYVCEPISKQQLITFVIDGAILHSTAALSEYFRTPPQPCEWFSEKVLPYLK